MATSAELSAIATSLRELTARITEISDASCAGEPDDTVSELLAIERSLMNASRRLTRLVGVLPPEPRTRS